MEGASSKVQNIFSPQVLATICIIIITPRVFPVWPLQGADATEYGSLATVTPPPVTPVSVEAAAATGHSFPSGGCP